MDYTFDENMLYNKNLMFYSVALSTLNFLKQQDFMRYFKTYETYDREDFPDSNLPAVCCYISSRQSDNTAQTVSCALVIKLINNSNIHNRGNIYRFMQPISDMIIEAIVYNNDFYQNCILKNSPWIKIFASKIDSNFYDDGKCFKLMIFCQAFVQDFIRYREENAFQVVDNLDNQNIIFEGD